MRRRKSFAVPSGEVATVAPTVAFANERLDDRFAQWVEFTPDAPAVQHAGTIMSYAEIDRRANRIAHRLQALGAGAEKPIGLCLERSIDLVATILAIVKAGSAYVPLDPGYPADRLAYMLENSGATILVTRGTLAENLDFSGDIVDLDVQAALIDALHDDAPLHHGTAQDTAYIIYTSGSTGRPKGVAVRHTPVALAEWARRTFPHGEMARIAFTASVCFDMSVFELWGGLCNGGLVIIKENILQPFTSNERPTMLQTVPSLARELLRPGGIPDSVRVVLVGGEVVKGDLVRQLYALPHIEQVFNMYGPTEATVWTTAQSVPRDSERDPPIGYPICGARLYVLNEDRQPTNIGDEGELYIAGPLLAAGYWNDPEKTAAAFVPDPFSLDGAPMYRTGDLVRMLPSGDIEYRQRIGEQVKLRGFRIELGEIEAALLRLPNVSTAAALVKCDDRGNDRLRGYVAVDGAFDPIAARAQLGAWLPKHMVPATVAVLPAMPLNLSGKIDRGVLRTIIDKAGDRAQEREWLLPIEDIVADTFEDVLGVHLTNADQDFFDLGGDSLLAIQVALQLEEAIGKPISPALMAHGASPRQLGAAINQIEARDEGYLTRVQPLGQAPPLFCAPDIYGRSLSYTSLARRFAPHFPIHGLAVGSHRFNPDEPLQLDVLLANWAQVIRQTQSAGPYRICGFSFGGPIACALANFMERDGDEVRLYLIDSPLLRALPPVSFMARWAWREWQRSVADVGLSGTLRGIARTRRTWLRWFFPNRRFGAGDVPNWVPGAYFETALALIGSTERYALTPFSGKTLLIRCSDQPAMSSFADADGALGWRGLLAGETETLTIDTTHYRLMQEPAVGLIAAKLAPAGHGPPGT